LIFSIAGTIFAAAATTTHLNRRPRSVAESEKHRAKADNAIFFMIVRTPPRFPPFSRASRISSKQLAGSSSVPDILLR
jgi:hypothetical protein